jgi:hypothetical protein
MLLTLTMTAGLVLPALAKGPTVKLAISGPDLPGELMVTDPKALEASVYGGEFIESQKGAVPAPSADLPRYTIQFYVQPPHRETRMMYVVDYVWDPLSNRALVHLPGRGDRWSSLNMSTILRSGQDGKWFYASQQWGASIRSALHSALKAESR